MRAEWMVNPQVRLPERGLERVRLQRVQIEAGGHDDHGLHATRSGDRRGHDRPPLDVDVLGDPLELGADGLGVQRGAHDGGPGQPLEHGA